MQITLVDQVYAALLRWDRLTIDDVAAKFDVSRTDAGAAVMALLERDDVIERGAGIQRIDMTDEEAAELPAAPAPTVELTDLLDDITATVALDKVAATIRRWHGPVCAADNCPACVAARDSVEKADEFQAAILADDHVTAAELAAELAVGYDIRSA